MHFTRFIPENSIMVDISKKAGWTPLLGHIIISLGLQKGVPQPKGNKPKLAKHSLQMAFFLLWEVSRLVQAKLE